MRRHESIRRPARQAFRMHFLIQPRRLGCILELPPSRARKPEIRNSKPETNPKHQAGNDQNHYTTGGSWPWTIGHLNLFRVSGFGFQIWDHSAQR